MTQRVLTQVMTPEDLGNAVLGSPYASIVPIALGNRIDRAEYGRRLAEVEGGIFTPLGYIVPDRETRRPINAT